MGKGRTKGQLLGKKPWTIFDTVGEELMERQWLV